MVHPPRSNNGLASGGMGDGDSAQGRLGHRREGGKEGKASGVKMSMRDQSNPKSYLRLHLLNTSHKQALTIG